ncbi:hypothetical protein KIN20_019323 [Parelaphostrongylus tenuis]|uniref:Uncharacterized protein n=1 Tax=Parelaphostrongylus tenuis TaxID=148309 RepID=A0AAD5QST1_PARTN|nr:hypothetical protein KIN20_019323 [Parelaphostrongylus tenuis]
MNEDGITNTYLHNMELITEKYCTNLFRSTIPISAPVIPIGEERSENLPSEVRAAIKSMKKGTAQVLITSLPICSEPEAVIYISRYETRASGHARMKPSPWTTRREDETNGRCAGVDVPQLVKVLLLNYLNHRMSNDKILRRCGYHSRVLMTDRMNLTFTFD